MRILFDECVPRRLCLSLTGHDIHTVPEMGWSGRRNGELLELMIVAKFQLFITVDQNLRYQRNLATAGIAVVVLIATSNRLAELLPLMPSVHEALIVIKVGEVLEIKARISHSFYITTAQGLPQGLGSLRYLIFGFQFDIKLLVALGYHEL